MVRNQNNRVQFQGGSDRGSDATVYYDPTDTRGYKVDGGKGDPSRPPFLALGKELYDTSRSARRWMLDGLSGCRSTQAGNSKPASAMTGHANSRCLDDWMILNSARETKILVLAHFRSLKTTLHLAKLPAMTTLERTPVNQAKLAQAENAWRTTLTDTLRRGFYGSITVEVSVQDGTIQHIRRRIEQVEK